VGFLSAYSGTKRIDFDGGYWVEVKECLNIVEKQRAERALTGTPTVDMNGRGTARMDQIAFHNEMLAAAITGWNLDDDDGAVWPLTPDSVKRSNIARLPAPVFDQILRVVDGLNGPRGRDEQVRFPDAGDGGDPVGDDGSGEPELLRA
jgi:hypothetical protein